MLCCVEGYIFFSTSMNKQTGTFFLEKIFIRRILLVGKSLHYYKYIFSWFIEIDIT